MQDSIRLSVGLGCVCGLTSLGYAVEPPQGKTAAVVGRSAVDVPHTVAGKSPVKATRTTRTAYRVVRAQNEFEEPAVEQRGGVIPPPAPSESPTGSDALKRLRDRSAKARWDQLHQEWLKARKNRNSQIETVRPQAPAAEQPGDPATDAANPFESNEPGTEGREPANDSVPSSPEFEAGAERRTVPVNPVLLQAQPKPRQTLPTDEELSKLLNADGGERLPPPVRDPAALPKITEILPNPQERKVPVGRPIPEQDPNRYVQLGNIPYVARTFPEFTYTFEATNVWSHPLYFEDPTLERYGHSHHPLIQPIASVARFGAQVVFLPYQLTLKPLGAQIYPVGWYAPGEYVPYRLHQPPLNRTAAAAQAATILGFSYALP